MSNEARMRKLVEEPYRFDLFQAVRMIECLYPGHPRLGESLHPKDDPVRLGQEPSLSFAPSAVAGFEPGGAEGRARLTVLSFGLFGPNGPLPMHLTEYARDRDRNADDPTFRRFADIFHHRMLSLFYRAWANAEPAVSFDRQKMDRFAFYVGSLCGLGLDALHDRDDMPDLAKLYFVGPLARQTKPPSGLESMLADFFRIPVEVEEYVGRWIELPHDCRWRLGETPETGALGQRIAVGSRVWERQTKFRIRLGPLSLDDYRRMLPSGESLDRLAAIVRNYTGDELTWDVRLILDKKDVPPLVLGGTGRLGRTAWMAGRPFRDHADDLLLDPLAGEFTHD